MKKNSGFTLFELLVVISIISLIVAVTSASFSSAQKRARDARRRQDLNQVHKALEQYYAQNSAYPNLVDDCVPGAEFLPGGLPSDPKGGTYSFSWNCDLDSYCICAELELTTAGNASGVGTANACSYAADDAYYCLQNVQ